MPNSVHRDIERPGRKDPRRTIPYWLARVVVGILTGVAVSVLTFFVLWRWVYASSDNGLMWPFKVAAIAGAAFALLVIVIGADALDLVDSIFFGGTRNR